MLVFRGVLFQFQSKSAHQKLHAAHKTKKNLENKLLFMSINFTNQPKMFKQKWYESLCFPRTTALKPRHRSPQRFELLKSPGKTGENAVKVVDKQRGNPKTEGWTPPFLMTLQGSNIFPPKWDFEDDDVPNFPRWDMLVSYPGIPAYLMILEACIHGISWIRVCHTWLFHHFPLYLDFLHSKDKMLLHQMQTHFARYFPHKYQAYLDGSCKSFSHHSPLKICKFYS